MPLLSHCGNSAFSRASVRSPHRRLASRCTGATGRALAGGSKGPRWWENVAFCLHALDQKAQHLFTLLHCLGIGVSVGMPHVPGRFPFRKACDVGLVLVRPFHDHGIMWRLLGRGRLPFLCAGAYTNTSTSGCPCGCPCKSASTTSTAAVPYMLAAADSSSGTVPYSPPTGGGRCRRGARAAFNADVEMALAHFA